MHELTALELGIAIGELREKIAGSYLKKFYDLGNESFRLTFYKGGRSTVVYCRLGATFNESRFSEESGPASGFAMAVRKRVEGARVSSVEQYRSDRIVVMVLENNRQQYRLVFEMFGQGNLVVLGKDDTVELAYKNVTYRDRAVKPKAVYKFPESSFVETGSMTRRAIEEVVEKVAGSDDKLIVALSRYINVGPIYLEDIINRAGLNPKQKAAGMKLGALVGGIEGFADELKRYKAREYFVDGGRDYSVIDLLKYEGAMSREYGSLNELLDEVFLGERTAVEDKSGRALEEAEANVRKQLELARSLKEESASDAQAGNRIFERMNEVNELISYMRSSRKPELADLQSRFPGLKIKGIDLKNKTVDIEL